MATPTVVEFKDQTPSHATMDNPAIVRDGRIVGEWSGSGQHPRRGGGPSRDGADTFYRGEIARKIAADMAANGGIITYADLAQSRSMERAAVRGRYRGHAIFSPSPPVSTGIQLVESPQVLGHYTPKTDARAATDATYWHQVIEAWKVRDPLRRVAEPERRPVDFAEHLQLDHAARLFRRIDPAKASTYERQGDDGPFTPPATRIGRGTTAFAVGCVRSALIAAQFRSRGIRAGPRAS